MAARPCSSPTGVLPSPRTLTSSSPSRGPRRATISRSAGSTTRARPTPPQPRFNRDSVDMKARFAILLATAALALCALASVAPRALAADTPDPVAEAKLFRDYFTNKFPKVKLEDFVNGPYSMNEDMHKQWLEKEEFPPYEFALDAGKEMFE